MSYRRACISEYNSGVSSVGHWPVHRSTPVELLARGSRHARRRYSVLGPVLVVVVIAHATRVGQEADEGLGGEVEQLAEADGGQQERGNAEERQADGEHAAAGRLGRCLRVTCRDTRATGFD